MYVLFFIFLNSCSRVALVLHSYVSSSKTVPSEIFDLMEFVFLLLFSSFGCRSTGLESSTVFSYKCRHY